MVRIRIGVKVSIEFNVRVDSELGPESGSGKLGKVWARPVGRSSM
jgi:hypothetical protein